MKFTETHWNSLKFIEIFRSLLVGKSEDKAMNKEFSPVSGALLEVVPLESLSKKTHRAPFEWDDVKGDGDRVIFEV